MFSRIQSQARRFAGLRQSWFILLILIAIILMVLVVGIPIANEPARIEGVVTFNRQPRGHDVNLKVPAGDLPPVGGVHHELFQKCGIYANPIATEKAVHSMENGAVWITYQESLPETDIAILREKIADQQYLLLSPYPGQRSPIVLSSWGVQLELESVQDERLEDFITRYRLGPLTPERGASCTDGSGRSNSLTLLRHILDTNYELVLFASGLVFFVVGMAISLQSRRNSRLQLARSLRWLSLFGITYGLHEWGLLFVPIQALYMKHLAISMLQLLQILLLATAYFSLFAFGVDLLQEKWPRLKVALYVVALIWLIWVLLTVRSNLGMGLLQQQAMILANYLIAFPGALLAAYGLLYQARRHIKPLKLQVVYNTTVVASIALVLFAFIGGLVVPYADFFPANVINQSLLVAYTGIPTQVYLSIVGLVLAVAVIRVLEVFDLETGRLIEKMQVEQNMAAERERIGREIHDGAIQTLYTAGLIVESTRRRVDKDPILTKRLDRVMTALNETVTSLRANMNELRAESQPLSLVEGLRQCAQDPRFTSLMELELELNLPETAVFNSAQTTHILAITAEALTNAARHARPGCARIVATSKNGQFALDISDDGDGFPQRRSDGRGYGLRNMRDRARLLGGELTIVSSPGKGTTVTLTVPWEAL